ncbi:hypothetical protein BGI51_00950 [Pseudomonas oryzihabitans]|nr:hypothetical protein BGI51_00950 [Pseudomonas psychrotolerans]
MGLVSEAGGQGDLGQAIALTQVLPCQANAPVDKVGMGRQAIAPAKAANQLGGREIRHLAELIQADTLAAVGIEKFGGAPQAAILAGPRCRDRGTPQARQYGLEIQQRLTLALQGEAIRVDQAGMQGFQTGVQLAVTGQLYGQRLEVVSPRALQLGQPAGVHVQHAIAPGVLALRIAGMDVTGIHQHQGARPHQFAGRAVVIATAPTQHGTYGEGLVGMRGIAERAAVLDGTGFEEGQRGIAPEA